jgi:hypothetical protein
VAHEQGKVPPLESSEFKQNADHKANLSEEKDNLTDDTVLPAVEGKRGYDLSLRGPELEILVSKLHTDSPSFDSMIDSSNTITHSSALSKHLPNLGARPKQTHKASVMSPYDTLKSGKQLSPNRARAKMLMEGDNVIVQNTADNPDNNPTIIEQLKLQQERLDRLQLLKENLKKPTEVVQLYGYQTELAKPALSNLNCILCAPTGSGKTYTAGHICYTKWKEAQEDRKKFQV